MATFAHGVGEQHGKETDAGVEVSDTLTRPRLRHREEGLAERDRRPDVHLPEHSATDGEAVPHDLQLQLRRLPDGPPVDNEAAVEARHLCTCPPPGLDHERALAMRIGSEHLHLVGAGP